MKTLNGKIVIGAPFSRVRYEDAGHICADCLEHKPNVAPDIKYIATYLTRNKPAAILAHCHVCEREQTVLIVRPSDTGENQTEVLLN